MDEHSNKRKRGRSPGTRSPEKRTVNFHLNLSPSESEQLRQEAASRGFTQADLARLRLFRPKEPSMTLERLNAEIERSTYTPALVFALLTTDADAVMCPAPSCRDIGYGNSRCAHCGDDRKVSPLYAAWWAFEDIEKQRKQARKDGGK